MSRYINEDAMMRNVHQEYSRSTPYLNAFKRMVKKADGIDLVLCKDCKHRPVVDDPNEDADGFNLMEPSNGSERCPCLVGDRWYSWMPDDNFYCGFGERSSDDES